MEALFRSGSCSIAHFNGDYLFSDFSPRDSGRVQILDHRDHNPKDSGRVQILDHRGHDPKDSVPVQKLDHRDHNPKDSVPVQKLDHRDHNKPWVWDESAPWRGESSWWNWSEHDHDTWTWSDPDADANGASTWHWKGVSWNSEHGGGNQRWQKHSGRGTYSFMNPGKSNQRDDYHQAWTQAESPRHVLQHLPRADWADWKPSLRHAPPRLATLLEGSVLNDLDPVEKELDSVSQDSFASDQSTTSQNSWMSACSSEGPQCFLPETLFQTYHGGIVQAIDLELGSMIASPKGEPLEVVAVKTHTAYQLVGLIAGSTQLIVSPSHRVVVDAEDATTILARDLEPDHRIRCAAGSHTLQEVRKFSQPDGQEVLEIRFRPDEAVAAFLPPGPILTMGGIKKAIRRGGVQKRRGYGASSGSRSVAPLEARSSGSDLDSRPPSIPDTDTEFDFPQYGVQSAPSRSSANT